MIPLQFELITFRFAYVRILKTVISMNSGFLAVSLTPNTVYLYLWRHQDTQNNPRRIQNHFEPHYFVNLRLETFSNMVELCVPHNLNLRNLCF